VEDVEIALTLFYRLGEVVGEEEIRTGTGLLGELVPMLLAARFSCHTHRLVALVYLETVTRYMKFMQEHVQYVPHLLGVFLDNRGIHHQNAHVSRRAGYLFMRAVKLLKAKLVPYLDTILQVFPFISVGG
jgi:exportin-T